METGSSRQIFEKMNKFGQKLACLILMTLTQITKNSLTDKNYCLMNFDGEGRSGSPHSPIRGQARTSPTMPNHRVVKIPTIFLKFPLSPRLRLLIYFVNETALPYEGRYNCVPPFRRDLGRWDNILEWGRGLSPLPILPLTQLRFIGIELCKSSMRVSY